MIVQGFALRPEADDRRSEAAEFLMRLKAAFEKGHAPVATRGAAHSDG